MDGTASGVRALSRTWAEVDLGAVRHNVSTLKRRAAGARLMAVVKADAYGHGAVPVARAALEAGADSLAVVTVEEGAELRRAGPDRPRSWSSPTSRRNSLPLAREHRLAVTAHSIPSAKRIAASPGLEAHLKVNTGMNRWGVEPSEVGEARKILGSQLAGVYTHFASADSDEGATRRQIRAFEAVLAAHPFGGVAGTRRELRGHPLASRVPATTASGQAWRSTACTLPATTETRQKRDWGQRWRSRATSPACGGSRQGTGSPTG